MEHLADLARIDLGGPEVFGDIDLNADRGAGACKLNSVRDELGDGNHAPDRSAAFGKGQQLRGQECRALAGACGFIEEFLSGLGGVSAPWPLRYFPARPSGSY